MLTVQAAMGADGLDRRLRRSSRGSTWYDTVSDPSTNTNPGLKSKQSDTRQQGEITKDAVYIDAERRFQEMETETKKLHEQSQK